MLKTNKKKAITENQDIDANAITEPAVLETMQIFSTYQSFPKSFIS